ncbi:hypothetical protein IAR55_000537 [Kwoniella newhampshirensis]|uniref:TEL2-interacting protein 1 n=1 Tax=Kwoniella newhampshirensis TaxID=1651941 RepID=A0AAW0Z6V8_9TREE
MPFIPSSLSALAASHAQSSTFGNRTQNRPTMLQGQQARMETFRKVKPICVALMGIASQPPTPHSQHAHFIDSLSSTLSSLPSTALDAAMINYILFPITNIMRQADPSSLPDNFLEAAFRLLAYTVRAWRDLDGGMDITAWEQLWRFSIAAVGPRIGASQVKDKGKGKGKEVGQEVQLQAVNLLAALLEPNASSSSRTHPNPAMLEQFATPKSPLLPTLFQTITFLLETAAPSPPYLQLQLSSLRLLRPLIKVYLARKHEVLAAVLPGCVSAMSKLVHAAGRSLKGEVAKEAAGVIEDVVVGTLSDSELREVGVIRPIVDDLSQLAEEWEKTVDPSPPNEPPPPSLAPSSTSTSTLANPFPPLTSSYLEFTSTQLLSAIPAILSLLSSHTSDLARHAAVSLAYSLADQCHESLPHLTPRALTALLLLSRDPFDPVQLEARQKFRQLLDKDDLVLGPTLLDILSNAINSVPRLVTSQQDPKVGDLAQLITAIAETTSEASRLAETSKRNAIADLLGPDGAIERWSWALLDCLEFGRLAGWTAAGNFAARTAQRGWEQRPLNGSAVPSLLEDGNSSLSPTDAHFPNLPLRYVESASTVRALGEMLFALGSAGGEPALHSVEYLVLFAKGNRRRQIAKAVSALWVAEKLLDGMATSQLEGVEGRVSKAVEKMAKDVSKIIVAIDDDDDDEEEEYTSYKEDSTSDALLPVERSKGLDTLTTLLDKKPLPNTFAAAETRRLHVQAQRSLLTALSLQTLALCSRVLSSSFRPLLLTSLYIILSHLASPLNIIQEYASIALAQVAYHSGYASTQNLVIDNVDYVINVVTQRLTHKRLSSTAPLVLIAMIRLVGEPIVPLVHDVVDEIFDALDDYHGYETLATSLLAVLVTLIEVMAAEVDADGPSAGRLKKLEEFRRVEKPPSPENDFELFFKWSDERDKRNKEVIEDILERAPQHAWGKGDSPKEEAEDEAEADPDVKMEDGDGETPATRSQQVAARILEKSIYFITHRSPFLRSKVLALISLAVPVLASGNRESDLLPLIHNAWGSILNRLDDPEPYVVTESAEVIASLCEHVGDFMSKRVLDHVWPRFKKLLEAQRLLDQRSALTRRSGGAGITMGTESSHTVSHRLHLAILKTAKFIVEEVPVSESVLWEIVLVFRPCLDKRTHEELQSSARELYLRSGKRDGDAVWLALNATLGRMEGDNGVWDWLTDERLDIGGNANIILAEV